MSSGAAFVAEILYPTKIKGQRRHYRYAPPFPVWQGFCGLFRWIGPLLDTKHCNRPETIRRRARWPSSLTCVSVLHGGGRGKGSPFPTAGRGRPAGGSIRSVRPVRHTPLRLRNMVAASGIGFVRHEGGIRGIETDCPLRHPAHPCNTL